MEIEQELIAKVPLGSLFEHYSGKQYQILAVGRHSEDLGLCVVYQGIYECPTFGANPIWIRPLAMFLETVVVDGKEQPRFQLIQAVS